VEKLDFLKSFCFNLCSEEISRLKSILGHHAARQRRSMRKREWVGISYEDHKKLKEASPELRPESELRPGEVPLTVPDEST
jgi:hypothetical protein